MEGVYIYNFRRIMIHYDKLFLELYFFIKSFCYNADVTDYVNTLNYVY